MSYIVGCHLAERTSTDFEMTKLIKRNFYFNFQHLISIFQAHFKYYYGRWPMKSFGGNRLSKWNLKIGIICREKVTDISLGINNTTGTSTGNIGNSSNILSNLCRYEWEKAGRKYSGKCLTYMIYRNRFHQRQTQFPEYEQEKRTQCNLQIENFAADKCHFPCKREKEKRREEKVALSEIHKSAA